MMMRTALWLLALASFPFFAGAQEEPATITAPPDITASTDHGRCSAVVNTGVASVRGGGIHRVNGTRSDNQALTAAFPKGTTTITWMLTGGDGQSSSATQTITIKDDEPPRIAAESMTIDAE